MRDVDRLPETNPVIPGFYPDPSVCRRGEEYFLVNSSFGWFPGLPVWRSRNLSSWERVGNALDRQSQLNLDRAPVATGGLYAPTIRYERGRFWIVCTNVTHGGGFLVTADEPAGPWSEPVWLKDGAGRGIDPSLTFDGDDVWLAGAGAWGGPGIRVGRIDPATGRPLEGGHAGWAGTGGQYPEGPHLFRRGGWWYTTIAEGGTETMHMQTVARGPSPLGPWEPCPHNPVLTHRSLPSPLHALGHADFIEDAQGHWWCVFHGIRPSGYPWVHHLGRETCFAPVEWTEDGWPVVNGGRAIPARGLDGDPDRDLVWEARFDGGALGPEWVHLRVPPPGAVDASAPGRLRLNGTPDGPDTLGQVAFAGVRQTRPRGVAEAVVQFVPQRDGEEAGLTAYMNEGHHVAAALVRRSGEVRRVVRRRVGDLVVEDDLGPATGGAATLTIAFEPERYRVSADGSGQVDVLARYYATEVAGGFTGIVFGLYAHGAGAPASVPADFARFRVGD